MSNECRHGDCHEVPTVHAEVIRKHARPAVQWQGDFCNEHCEFALKWQMQNLEQRDRLVVEIWRWKDHGSSREPQQVVGHGGVHEGAGHHA